MWAVRHYEPIWTGLDPENRTAELLKALEGATFLGKTEHFYEAQPGDDVEGMGVRPMLLFATAAGWVLGLSCKRDPQAHWDEQEHDQDPTGCWAWPVGRSDVSAGVATCADHGTHLLITFGSPSCPDFTITVNGPFFILRGEEEQQ